MVFAQRAVSSASGRRLRVAVVLPFSAFVSPCFPTGMFALILRFWPVLDLRLNRIRCAGAQNSESALNRQIAIHVHEPARQRARERTTVPAFAAAQRQRRKVEALFAELKNQIGLRRVRLRRMKHVREQFFLAATAQNLKRLAQFLRSRSLESATMPI